MIKRNQVHRDDRIEAIQGKMLEAGGGAGTQGGATGRGLLFRVEIFKTCQKTSSEAVNNI